MKNLILLLALSMALTSNAQSVNSTDESNSFPPSFMEGTVDASAFLPNPPEMTSGAWYNDFYYYQWGKEQRQNDSIKAQAIADYHGTSLEYLEAMFSKAMGVDISKNSTPETHTLLQRCMSDAYNANSSAKKLYKRLRPFVQMGEPSIEPEFDEEEAAAYSFPSGHTTRCYVPAMVLAMVAPECTEAILNAARLYSLNRVICGHHYKSDTDTSVMLAMGVVAKLHGSEEFKQQYQKAVEEYRKLTDPTAITSAQAKERDSESEYYTTSGVKLPGKPVHKGVYIVR